MALYIPAGRRRRRTIIVGVAALAVGLLIGIALGRMTASSVTDEVHSARDSARATAAALRVIALHDEAGVGTAGSGDNGAALVLDQTRTDLDKLFARAPWITSEQRQKLLADLAALAAQPDRKSSEFGTAASALADEITTTFAASG